MMETFMPVRLPPALGNYVVGESFFGRSDELALLRSRLQARQHVTLIAQRRMGKTSLCKEAARCFSDEFTFFYVDLQHKRDAADAVAAIAATAREHVAAWTKVRALFGNLAGAIDSVGNENLSVRLRDAFAGDWRPQGERVLRALEGLQSPAVIVLDELPILLTNMLLTREGQWRDGGRESAAELLEWLRAMCIGSQGKLVIVVTGSVGLGPVAARAGASGALNHYAEVMLGPWQTGVAMDAARGLLASSDLELEPDAAEEMVACLGSCIPYHVQLLADQLAQDAMRRRGNRVSKLDVQRVYQTRVLASHGHTELAHMEERLLKVLPAALRALATDLLTQAAVQSPLSAPAAIALGKRTLAEDEDVQSALRDILAVLEHDGYLQREPGGWRFASRLLRDWWKARHELFFVPVGAG